MPAHRVAPVAAVLAAALLIAGPPPAPAAAQGVERSQQASFRVETVAGGLENPWGLAFLPDGAMLVTERPGRLRLVRDGRLEQAPIAGTPAVFAAGQGGLLDVAVHPDFASNGLVYLSYAGSGDGGAGTEVARGRLDLQAMRLTDVETIFVAAPKTGGRAHYGSRLLFAPDGSLYVTLGDRYSHMKEAQNPGTHLGSVIRITDSGGVPADNPFAGRSDARPEVFTYGHRNVQGMALHPQTGAVWTHEHGPRGGDEVNILKPGANYGWPAVTYGVDYSGAVISDRSEAPGMEPPLVHWVPSIAPSGMAFYSGEAFPQWQGDLFIGALAGAHLRRLELDGDRVTAQEELLVDLNARIRDVRSGPDGFLYLLTDASDGRLLRLVPAS
ncbi:PQQ-dependent sugar dehydrogenase [Caenispirillum bisanense]|uniref:PQQ-dependent sugar dehydrogenase n=1 Tax=Caenispirillum bisanense TaxID=414052 RepID=UPI0031D5D530